jgi:Zn-finger nucleic acid-binding protein
MNCPIDHHSLEQKDFNGFEIDFCSSCHGLWFDEGQFRIAIQKFSDFSLPEKYQLAPENEPPKNKVLASQERNIHCSRDNSIMKTLNYGGGSNVFLDRCDTCKGIWLDKGEIVLVKKFLEPNTFDELMAHLFAESMKEEKEQKEHIETTLSLPFLLFAPAFLVPVPDGKQEEYIPRITIILMVLAVVLNWRISMEGMDKCFPWMAIVLFFWVFGKSVEHRLSAEYYIFLCAIASIAGSVATLFGSGIPVGQSPLVAMASMASGVMGAYLVFFPREKISFLVRGRKLLLPAWPYLIGWLIFQFVGLPSETTMGISFMSNVSGFVSGFIFALIWRRYSINT